MNAAETGAYLRGKLEELLQKHPIIGDDGGMGLMQRERRFKGADFGLPQSGRDNILIFLYELAEPLCR